MNRTWQDWYVSGQYKYDRGMNIIRRPIDLLKISGFTALLNEFILNPLGLYIPPSWLLYMIPVIAVVAFSLGYLDQHKLKIWQKEQEYAPRNINPWSQELLRRLKNVERLVGVAHDGGKRENE